MRHRTRMPTWPVAQQGLFNPSNAVPRVSTRSALPFQTTPEATCLDHWNGRGVVLANLLSTCARAHDVTGKERTGAAASEESPAARLDTLHNGRVTHAFANTRWCRHQCPNAWSPHAKVHNPFQPTELRLGIRERSHTHTHLWLSNAIFFEPELEPHRIANHNSRVACSYDWQNGIVPVRQPVGIAL